MTESEYPPTNSWDRCLARSIVNTGVGFGAGVLFSVILFRRKTWPIAMGMGFGAGMGYAQCQFGFLHPDMVHGRIVSSDKFLEQRGQQTPQNH
eukprot:m.60161 g.60161  ORF g.60161 m.60161 type:complete len:93 (-) comp13266_c0_seq1:292-570(-)